MRQTSHPGTLSLVIYYAIEFGKNQLPRLAHFKHRITSTQMFELFFPTNTKQILFCVIILKIISITNKVYSVFYKLRRLTLLFADSYISLSTLRAYETRFSMRLSFRAAGSGVGNMACTLQHREEKWL